MCSSKVDIIGGGSKDFWMIVSGRHAGVILQMSVNLSGFGFDAPLSDPTPSRTAMTLCFQMTSVASGINAHYRDHWR